MSALTAGIHAKSRSVVSGVSPRRLNENSLKYVLVTGRPAMILLDGYNLGVQRVPTLLVNMLNLAPLR